MTGKNDSLMKEYKELFMENRRHSYIQKRAAFHLAKISTMDNLTRQHMLNTESQKGCAEAQTLTTWEVKKYGACKSRKKEPEK